MEMGRELEKERRVLEKEGGQEQGRRKGERGGRRSKRGKREGKTEEIAAETLR
jgi:hypothetical protein